MGQITKVEGFQNSEYEDPIGFKVTTDKGQTLSLGRTSGKEKKSQGVTSIKGHIIGMRFNSAATFTMF